MCLASERGWWRQCKCSTNTGQVMRRTTDSIHTWSLHCPGLTGHHPWSPSFLGPGHHVVGQAFSDQVAQAQSTASTSSHPRERAPKIREPRPGGHTGKTWVLLPSRGPHTLSARSGCPVSPGRGEGCMGSRKQQSGDPVTFPAFPWGDGGISVPGMARLCQSPIGCAHRLGQVEATTK